MYQKGEYVVYGTNGPCMVEDVTKLKIPGCDAKRFYYVLRPVKTGKSVIYSPVDNEKVMIRPILSEEEATVLLQNIPQIALLEVESEKVREETYKNVLHDSDLRRWIGLMKMLCRRRRDRLKQGRKITTVDERYLKETEDLLGSELSLALGKDIETAKQMLFEQLELLTTAG
ncbi:MAG: CarD family transcriptional regulator [Blautia sp.]|nr:CarD family transcriptional regulator [Blautia sp.]